MLLWKGILRRTVILGSNVTGNLKLEILPIGKSKSPTSFKGSTKIDLNKKNH